MIWYDFFTTHLCKYFKHRLVHNNIKICDIILFFFRLTFANILKISFNSPYNTNLLYDMFHCTIYLFKYFKSYWVCDNIFILPCYHKLSQLNMVIINYHISDFIILVILLSFIITLNSTARKYLNWVINWDGFFLIIFLVVFSFSFDTLTSVCFCMWIFIKTIQNSIHKTIKDYQDSF